MTAEEAGHINIPLVDLASPRLDAATGSPRGVAILGATGSIGKQAIRVISRHKDLFSPVVVSARSDATGLAEIAARLQPKAAILSRDDLSTTDQHETEQIFRSAGYSGRVLTGEDALLEEIRNPEVEIVLNAIVGFSGIRATISALRSGKRLALANKESLVAGGDLVAAALREGGGAIVPVDSEHAALVQCLRGWDLSEVESIYLTCSGGPFRGKTEADLSSVTPTEALAHPTWNMGPKITVDSATLMNKGLEVIEAHWLFGLDYSSIGVVVHPQSIVHAIASFIDGSSVAHLAEPDMENPILFALGYPLRLSDRAGALSWGENLDLHFEAPDTKTFRCLQLAYEAGRLGGGAPCVLNAANEVAVAAFLDGRLNFADIATVVESVLSKSPLEGVGDLESLIDLDRIAREQAEHEVSHLQTRQRAKVV
jgi:1-deoxy-D-xylulose-5-phosphate reductoisomerase